MIHPVHCSDLKKKYSSKHDHPFRLPISSAHLQILNRLTLYNKQPCASLQLHYSKSRKTLAEKRATSVGGARCLLYSAQRKSLNSPTLSFNILTYFLSPFLHILRKEGENDARTYVASGRGPNVYFSRFIRANSARGGREWLRP